MHATDYYCELQYYRVIDWASDRATYWPAGLLTDWLNLCRPRTESGEWRSTLWQICVVEGGVEGCCVLWMCSVTRERRPRGLLRRYSVPKLFDKSTYCNGCGPIPPCVRADAYAVYVRRYMCPMGQCAMCTSIHVWPPRDSEWDNRPRCRGNNNIETPCFLCGLLGLVNGGLEGGGRCLGGSTHTDLRM